jgi:hypothetical protein
VREADVGEDGLVVGFRSEEALHRQLGGAEPED